MRQKRIFKKPPDPALFPPTTEELVEPGHIVRSLKELAERVVGKELRELYEDHGGVPYDPVALFCVEMYGYMLGIRSSRQLEELCRYDARFWFLTGSLRPDHVSLCRFRERLAGSLDTLFTHVLAEAQRRKMVGTRAVAVDGTKIQGNVAQWRRVLKEAEAADHPGVDTDARRLRDKNRPIAGYNCQIAVDTEHDLILAAVVRQDANDQHVMPEMLEKIQSTVGALPRQIVADAGFDSSETHAALESSGVEGNVALQDPRSAFWQIDSEDSPVCPLGHVAQFSGTHRLNGKLYERYLVRECAGCALRLACGVKRYKTLNVPQGLSSGPRIRNALRSRTDEFRALQVLRRQSVERVFAEVKSNRGLTRFRYKGMAKVTMEFQCACLAHNLRTLIRGLCALFRSFLRLPSLVFGPHEPLPAPNLGRHRLVIRRA